MKVSETFSSQNWPSLLQLVGLHSWPYFYLVSLFEESFNGFVLDFEDKTKKNFKKFPPPHSFLHFSLKIANVAGVLNQKHSFYSVDSYEKILNVILLDFFLVEDTFSFFS